MGPYDDMSICLHADWKHCQTASIRFTDLHDLHWHQPPGAPQALLHGYVACADIVTGNIPHTCDPTTAPHRLQVCVLKRHTIPVVYAELVRQADKRRRVSPGDQPISIRAVTPARAKGL